MEQRERTTLVLEPVPGWDVPPAVRLRRLLKAALRSYGLRCVAVRGEEIPPSPPGNEQEGPSQPVSRSR